MILKLKVNNILSYRNEQVFDFKIDDNENPENIVHSNNPSLDVSISNFVYIFGKNNAGKTCLLSIIQAIQSFVLTGHNTLTPYHSKNDKHSEFEIEFLVDSAVVRYGTQFISATIMSEWLYIRPQGSNQEVELFSRKQSKICLSYPYAQNQFNDTLSEQLYLYKLLKDSDNSEQTILLNEIYQFFLSIINLETTSDVLSSKNLKTLYKSSELLKHLNDQIRCFDLNIKAIEIEPVVQDEIMTYNIIIICQDEDHKLQYEHLSCGTKKIIIYLIASLISEQTVYLIDEVETSLHSHALNTLIHIMTTKTNQTRNQFILTSHVLDLLDNTHISNKTKFLLENTNGTQVTCVADYTHSLNDSISTSVANGWLPGSPIIIY